MRRSSVRDARFDPADGFADDLGMFLRLVRRIDAVAYIAEPLVAIRLHAAATSTTVGFHEFRDGVFLPTPLAIENIRRSRKRFLRQYGRELEGVNEIRTASRAWIRQMLIDITVSRWRSGDQSRLAGWRLFTQAAWIDPFVLLTPDYLKLMLRGVLGPRVRKLLRKMRRIGHAARQSSM
jgi:hypothetical protein